MKYIVIQHGCPHVADDLPLYEPNRLAILGRTWEHIHAFNESSRYALLIEPEPTSSIVQRILAHTIYNPAIPVTAEWRNIGERRTSDILTLVKDGLQRDDDIIQQWFGASEIMRLLKAADSWKQLLIAVDCICGGHEVNDDAKRFVDLVLPHRA